jgi:hypothetical protein
VKPGKAWLTHGRGRTSKDHRQLLTASNHSVELVQYALQNISDWPPKQRRIHVQRLISLGQQDGSPSSSTA